VEGAHACLRSAFTWRTCQAAKARTATGGGESRGARRRRWRIRRRIGAETRGVCPWFRRRSANSRIHPPIEAHAPALMRQSRATWAIRSRRRRQMARSLCVNLRMNAHVSPSTELHCADGAPLDAGRMGRSSIEWAHKGGSAPRKRFNGPGGHVCATNGALHALRPEFRRHHSDGLARQALGMTQGELADLFETSRRTVTRSSQCGASGTCTP
jgi:hypothetical protein